MRHDSVMGDAMAQRESTDGEGCDDGARAPERDAPRSIMRALEETLRSETRNLRRLLDVLQSQRTAVATSDIDTINDNVFVMHRVLLTLGEARQYRRRLAERLGASPDLAPQWGDARDLVVSVPPLPAPPWASAQIQELRDELHALATTVAREIETNRQILRGVITTGEELIRVLAGAAPPLFGAGGAGALATTALGMPNGFEGALINRTV